MKKMNLFVWPWCQEDSQCCSQHRMTKAKATVRRDIAGRERSLKLSERAQKVYMVSGEFGDVTADLI